MKIMKKHNLKLIIACCHQNINECYNTALKYIPLDIIKEYNKKNNAIIREIYIKNKELKKKTLEKINKTEKHLDLN